MPAIFILAFAGAAVLIPTALAARTNPGPHGLTEIVYAYAEAFNNNGSAFGGLSANTWWYDVTLALVMLVGRLGTMIPGLAIGGSLGRKKLVPATAGTFPTGTPLFGGLLVGVVVVVVGLTYFPVVALGPVVEHLVGHFGI
jgi:K+-transporting ATPase ATPase A chain